MGLLSDSAQQYYDGNDYGNYQFTSLDNIISQFEVAYVGENKIIPKIKRADISFHAKRALQELSFDTLKSIKAQEITVPATLQMTLPQDYVNYTKISWVDSAGIKHLLYPTSKTSNPFSSPLQDSVGDFTLQAVGNIVAGLQRIVLDKEYKDILVGMKVSGYGMNSSAKVTAVDHVLGITTISTSSTPTFAATGVTLTFTNVDGSLILPQKSSHAVSGLSWDNNILNFKITGYTGTVVKIGMRLYHGSFPDGTLVTNVNGGDIIVSSNPTNVSSNQQIVFVDTDVKDSATWSSYKSGTPSENQDDYQDDTYWPMNGSRFGLDPQHAQANGSFYIDNISGKIHFSSNISGKTVILDYISDSLGTDGEMQVHKFAEEAMYKCIAYAVLSTSSYGQQLVPRLTKEKFAAVRKAKLRLSNLKLEELTQILRGKSKQIKH